MRFFIHCCWLTLLAIACTSFDPQPKAVSPTARPDFAIVIHGGAGTILKKNMTPEKEQAVKAKLQEALDTGYAVLEKGGNALDAVTQTLNVLEDSPLFNAGKGAVYNAAGEQEMDASIMDGKTLNAGAVAGVSSIRNPINAARLVMEKSKHVMLSGKGAEEFAKQHGIRFEDKEYFYDERRLQQLKKSQQKEQDAEQGQGAIQLEEHEKYGTVGAAALDKQGNLAAATSTGGMTNKRFGRIGDSPVIGAGTYANNGTCAISCTGHGEYFIRNVVAYDMSALMQYKGLSITKAAEEIVHRKLLEMDAKGGLIGIDKDGNIVMSFNTAGMYRGYRKAKEGAVIGIYK